MSRRPGRQKSLQAHVEDWEFELIRQVTNAFRTPDREDLEAELTRELLELKLKSPPGIRNWKAYLKRTLYNEASNQLRDSRMREGRHQDLDEEILNRESAFVFRQAPLVQESHFRLALHEVWKELDPVLRQFWTVFLEERGNQIAAAKRLGKHRNTIRLWIRKIQTILKRHGF